MEGIVKRIDTFALIGLASGFAPGLFGIGGGIVRIPILIYLLPLFGVAHPVLMHVAVGTSMALVLPSAAASTHKQLALGNLNLAFFRTWALGVLVGVLFGTALLPFASTEILPGDSRCLHGDGRHLRGFPQESRAHREDRAARRSQAGGGRGDRDPRGVDRNRSAGARSTTRALQAFSIRLEAAIATASSDRAGNRRRRRHRRGRRGWHARDLPAYSVGYVDLAIFAAMMPTILIAAPIGVRAGHRLSEAWLRSNLHCAVVRHRR